MDASEITSLIGSLGFPIVMCLIFVWLIIRLEKQHKEEITSLQQTLERNTEALTKLYTLIENDLNEITNYEQH